MSKAAIKAALERFVVTPLSRTLRDVNWHNVSRRTIVFVCFAIAFLGFSFFMVESYVMPLDGLKSWGENYKDCGQFAWNLWHAAESLLDFDNPLQTDRVAYPIGANLAQHTLASGYAPLTLLVKLFSGNHPLYPIVAYNIAIWVSFTLLLAFSYLALREAGFCFWAAIIPAVGYAFSNFYYLHWLHLNLMAGFLLPLLAYLMIRLYKRPTIKRGLWFGFFTGYGIYLTEFSLSAVIAMSLFFLFALAIGPSRREILRVLRGLGWKGTAATVGLALVVALPFVLIYFQGDAVRPSSADFSRLGANAASYFIPESPYTTLYGDLLREIQADVRGGIRGGEVFLGYPFILCMLIGVFRPRRVFTLLMFAVGLCFVVLSLGTTLKFLDSTTEIELPYHWLRDVPPFDQNRAPVRFVAVAQICFIFVAASGVQFIVSGLSRWGLRFRDARTAICAGLLIWTVAETYFPTEHEHRSYTAPNRAVWTKLVDGPVVQWPGPRWPCNQMLIQVFHGHPIENACLARGAKGRTRQASEFSTAFRGGGAAYSKLLKQKGITNLVVTADLLAHEVEVLREIKGVNIVEFRRQPRTVLATWGDTKSHFDRLWHRAKKWNIRPRRSKVLDGKGELTASRIDVLADYNDRYKVELMSGDKVIATVWAERFEHTVGGQWRFLDVPRRARKKKFDSIKISPVEGDNRYSVAAIAVLK